MQVPTLGTSVFAQTQWSGSGSALTTNPNIVTDLFWAKRRNNLSNNYFVDRLRNNERLYSDSTSAGSINAAQVPADVFNSSQTVIKLGADEFGTSGSTWILGAFRRAPGFFDEVCYTGTGSAATITHNLAAVPELMIIKDRTTGGYPWIVYQKDVGVLARLFLNTTDAAIATANTWNATAPTYTNFSIGNVNQVSSLGDNYVAYLFATCAGVSKVGSYTGTGALQTVACGFTTGARYVLIKRTDSTGDWYVWDSARGITAGNDPYLLLNSTAAEVTGTNYVDTDTTGFKVTAAAPADINAVGGNYIFLAIA
jgi:hypothetical protein